MSDLVQDPEEQFDTAQVCLNLHIGLSCSTSSSLVHSFFSLANDTTGMLSFALFENGTFR